MGVLTTVIFWGTEMVFFYSFDFVAAQYVGGAIGLMDGYCIKYILDKKYERIASPLKKSFYQHIRFDKRAVSIEKKRVWRYVF